MSKLEPATLRRYKERGLYDVASAKKVFDDSFIVHVSYIDNGFPACQPMLALLREEWEDVEGEEPKYELANGTCDTDTDGNGRQKTAYIYLHGHPTTRLMELVKQSSKAVNGDTTNGNVPPEPVKVCITATKSEL